MTLSAGPVSLGPGESTTVKIEFFPNFSGTFSGNIGLAAIGSFILEINVIGRAATETELWAWFNTVCQAAQSTNNVVPAIPIPVHSSDMNTPLNGILYGFECMTKDEFRDLIRFIMSGDWEHFNPPLPPSPPLESSEATWVWDAQQFLQALQFLLAQPDLGQSISSILEGNHPFSPTFQTFVNFLNAVNFAIVIGPFSIPFSMDMVLGNNPGRQAVVYLVELLRRDSSLLETLTSIMNRLSQVDIPWITPLPESFARARAQISILYAFARIQAFAGLSDYQARGHTPDMVSEFVRAVNIIITATNPQEIAFIVLSVTLNRMIQEGRPTYAQSAEAYANNIAQIAALGSLVSSRWTITWAGALDPREGLNPKLHFVATKTIGGRPTAAFIHVQAKLDPDEVRLVAEILYNLAITAAGATSKYPGDFNIYGVGGGIYEGVVVLIAYRSDQDTVNRLVQMLGTPPLPVVIIWIDNQKIVHVTAVCGYAGCPGGATPQQYGNRIAQALGFQPGLPYNHNNNAYPVPYDPGQEQPPLELSEEELEMLRHYLWIMTMR